MAVDALRILELLSEGRHAEANRLIWSQGVTFPAGGSPTLQDVYDNSAGVGIAVADAAPIAFVRSATIGNQIPFILSSPADSIAGTTIPVGLELFSQGHTSPGEGGVSGVATTLLVDMIAQSNAGTIAGLGPQFNIALNTREVARWDLDCANGETLFWIAEKTGGVFTTRRVVRDPGTGALSAP